MISSSTSARCQYTQLARGPVGQAIVCPDCEVVHLELGNLTVRFELEAFLALSDMLAEAQARLHTLPCAARTGAPSRSAVAQH